MAVWQRERSKKPEVWRAPRIRFAIRMNRDRSETPFLSEGGIAMSQTSKNLLWSAVWPLVLSPVAHFGFGIPSMAIVGYVMGCFATVASTLLCDLMKSNTRSSRRRVVYQKYRAKNREAIRLDDALAAAGGRGVTNRRVSDNSLVHRRSHIRGCNRKTRAVSADD